MITSHAERMTLFRTRADREVSDRCDRRETAMPVLEAAAAKRRYESSEKDITARFKKERDHLATQGQGGRTTKLRYSDVKAAFLVEIAKRSVDFRTFFNDEVEARAVATEPTKRAVGLSTPAGSSHSNL